VIVALLFGAWVFYQNQDDDATSTPELDKNERVVVFSWTTRVEREVNITWVAGSVGDTKLNHREVAWNYKTTAKVGDQVMLHIRTVKYGSGTCRIDVNDKEVAKQSGPLWECGVRYTIQGTE
jgi:hypothetical protein